MEEVRPELDFGEAEKVGTAFGRAVERKRRFKRPRGGMIHMDSKQIWL